MTVKFLTWTGDNFDEIKKEWGDYGMFAIDDAFPDVLIFHPNNTKASFMLGPSGTLAYEHRNTGYCWVVHCNTKGGLATNAKM